MLLEKQTLADESSCPPCNSIGAWGVPTVFSWLVGLKKPSSAPQCMLVPLTVGAGSRFRITHFAGGVGQIPLFLFVDKYHRP
jgi:hypothetical protein